MAYKALYRTYRPSNFDEVAGQKHIVKTLQNAVQQNKIAHAYLFCGPRGTGKTSIAKIFAKAVNCEAEHDKPCLQCDNCLAVAENSHPDIVEIDAASNNGVEEVRSLIEKVKYAPIKGRYKVYIIDEVHMMSAGAFNALLKTIEEPPAHVIFILATTEPHKVLPTIISRCQRYDFTKVSQEEIINRIHNILDIEKITCEEEVIRIISQLSDGGMRDALSILDQCIAYARDDIKEHHINEIYGITTVKEKVALFNFINTGNAAKLMECIYEMIEKGIDIKRLTVDLIEMLKESVVYDYTKDKTLLHTLNLDELAIINANHSTQQRLEMIDVMMITYDKYRFAANVGSYFEVCLLKILGMIHTEKVTMAPAVENVIPATKAIQGINEASSVQVNNEDVSRETLLDDVEEIEIVEPIIEENILPIKENPEDMLVEDYKPVKGLKVTKPLNDEFVLQLLVGANKPEKNQDLEYFKNIDQYTVEIEWAKAANTLKNVDLMASSRQYLIIVVGNQAEANDINERDGQSEFLEFTNILLHKYKKLFAITDDQKNRVVMNFKQRMAEKTLPDPVIFEEVKIKKKEEVKEVSEEEAVMSLFGQENIIITEE